jgi:hypothetical protein
MHRARAARACGVGLKGPRSNLTMTTSCCFSSSAGLSKIKIRTSSWHKSNKLQLALCHDGVRILIFDDPSVLEEPQRPEFRFAQLESMHADTSLGCLALAPTCKLQRFPRFLDILKYPRRHQHAPSPMTRAPMNRTKQCGALSARWYEDYALCPTGTQ